MGRAEAGVRRAGEETAGAGEGPWGWEVGSEGRGCGRS